MDNQSYTPNFVPGSAAPASFNQPAQPNFNPGQPVAQKPTASSSWSTIQIIIVIIVSLLAAVFIGLFIWMLVKWRTAYNDVQGQIDNAVATAVNEKAVELENDFTEREKYPYKTFAGPADYGELTFEYPKTWSAFTNKDASSGGDFEAYLNPDVVPAIASDQIFSLRVTIKDQSFDNVTKTYESYLKNNKLALTVRPVGGENANIYTGLLDNKYQGIAAVFKIRDKTAIVRTDAMIFEEDFYRLLDTVKYSK